MQIKTYHGKTISLPHIVNELTEHHITLPALIDCHVHFRTPGQEYKEDWLSGTMAAHAGGVTTVCDMPNNVPSITTYDLLKQKKQQIHELLKNSLYPIHPYFYIGATTNNADEIRKCKNEVIGIKIFMGSSTGTLLVDKKSDQEKIFALAHELNLPIVAHAEDEALINANKLTHPSPTTSDHSLIRSNTVAATGVARAIELAEQFSSSLYLLHISTKEELSLIRAAKKRGVRVYAETTPHHLFLTVDDYDRLGTLAQMNPPLRTNEDQDALWEAVQDGTIDTIGSDHAPHTLAEKNVEYPASPSGVPGIETTLPLLLNAYHKGKITLEKIVALTHTNPQKIFNLPETNEWVIVDLNLKKKIKNENLKTKCHWSPFAEKDIQGWPTALSFPTLYLSLATL